MSMIPKNKDISEVPLNPLIHLVNKNEAFTKTKYQLSEDIIIKW